MRSMAAISLGSSPSCDGKAAHTTTATVEESPRKGRTDLVKTVAVEVNEDMMASVVRVDPAKLVASLVEQA